MQLLADKILVKPVSKEENKTDSGIIIGKQPKTKDDFEVILVGPKVQHCKIGDIIRKFPNVPGIETEYNGEKHLFLREVSEIEFIISSNEN